MTVEERFSVRPFQLQTIRSQDRNSCGRIVGVTKPA
jgi:hypothetical protein